MNTNSSLVNELRDKSYREAYVASQINIGLTFQIRALRLAREWSQKQLADLAGMKQPRICEIEQPGKRSMNLHTLQRLAAAFDVALDVRFVPFSDLIDRSEGFDPDAFDVPSFESEIHSATLETITAAVPVVESTGTITSTSDGAIEIWLDQLKHSRVASAKVIRAHGLFGQESRPNAA